MKIAKRLSQNLDRKISAPVNKFYNNIVNDYSIFFQDLIDSKSGLCAWIDKYIRSRSESNIDSVIIPGCGDGKEIVAFSELGYKADGFDISEFMLDCTEAYMRENNIDSRIFFYDFTQNFEENCAELKASYDAVIFLGNTIGHIPQNYYNKVFTNLSTFLKPSAFIAIEFRDGHEMFGNGVKFEYRNLLCTREHARLYFYLYNFLNCSEYNAYFNILSLNQNDHRIGIEKSSLIKAYFVDEYKIEESLEQLNFKKEIETRSVLSYGKVQIFRRA